MSLPADYISGTITLTNGSPNFTGTGTGWQAADFREGDILLGVEDHAGQVYVIAAITGNAAGTLTQEWAGTSGTYTYRMRYEWDSSRVSAQARAMVELLGNGNLESIAGLTGPGVVVLEGPHSAGIRPFTDFINGVAYNVQVDTLPDRAAYDGQSAGFAVLVSDVGDGRSALFSKASNTSGDWTDPAYITGPEGPAPEVEATVGMLPPGSTATVTPTPITGGVRLDFDLPEAEGFYWFSAYDPDEEYTKGSVVRHNRSAFIATQAVPVGESPSNAFPPVDNTYWDVLAAGGANGEGTVSSVEQGSGIAVDATDPTAPIISLDATFTDLKDVDFTTNPPENGNVPVWDETLEKFIPGAGGGGSVPRGHIYGLEYSNISGLTFDMSAGECASAGATPVLMKYAGNTALDLNVAFSTGKGCRFDASVSDGTWYVFLVSDGVNTAIGCSKSINPTTASNFPTGNSYQYLASLIVETGALRDVKQTGNRFRKQRIDLDYNATNPGTGAISVGLKVPTGISVLAFGYVQLARTNQNGTSIIISDLSQAAQTPVAANGFFTLNFDPNEAAPSGIENRMGFWEEATNTSGQVRSQIENSSASLVVTINTHGWYDLLRGQL